MIQRTFIGPFPPSKVRTARSEAQNRRRYSVRKIVIAFCFCCAPLNADQIFSCQVPTGIGTDQSVSGSDPCSLTGAFGSSASVGGDVSIPGFISGATTVSASFNVLSNVHAGVFGLSELIAIAGSNISWVADLTSAGPLRAGFIQINLGPLRDGIPLSDPGQASEMVKVDGFFEIVSGPNEDNGNNCPAMSVCEFTTPIMLGTTFSASLTGTEFVEADLNDESEEISAQGALSFSLFEADGVTPVAMTQVATPEPSTGLTMLLGLIVWRKIRSAALQRN
jgi:hypothetical protein